MSFNPPPLPPTQPTWGQFQIWWQAMLGNLQSELGALATAQAALAAAVSAAADAAAAQTTATTANTAAGTAQTTANTVKRDDAISASYTSPGTVLSAADAGSDATITIASHVRKYGDNTSLSVSGGSLTGRAYSTVYYIYYTDTTRANTTPSYQSTTDPNVALPTAAAGRHYVGKVTTPAAAAPPTSGGSAPPSGGGGIGGPEVP